MSANKTWMTSPYNGQNFVDPNSGLLFTVAHNPANPGDVTPAAPDAPNPDCKHTAKSEWPGLKTQSGVAVYVCWDCGILVTLLGVRVLEPQEIIHE